MKWNNFLIRGIQMESKFKKIKRLKKEISIHELIKTHPIITIFSMLLSFINLLVSIFEAEKSWNTWWFPTLVSTTVLFVSYLTLKATLLWNRYRALKDFSESIHEFIKDTSITDVEYLSKLDKEDERFLQSPVIERLYDLNESEIISEQRLFNKKYSSWTKEYLKTVFYELDKFLENTTGNNVDITLQLLTEQYNPDKQNMFYDSFVDKNRKSTKNRNPMVLNDTMEALIHFKENKKYFLIRECDTLVFCLSTVNISNKPPVFFGFISFKFEESIDESSSNFQLIINCLIAKVEELCYYVKVLGSSYGLFPSAVYNAAIQIEDEERQMEYINMAVELDRQLDFLKFIYEDFTSRGVTNND